MITIRKTTAESEDRRSDTRPIFSAYEIGKATTTRFELERETGHTCAVSEHSSVDTVYQLYQTNKKIDFLAILDPNGRIVGYLRRSMFLASLSQTHYSRELLMRPERTIAELMDPRVVIVDAFQSLSEASRLLMEREESIRFDPFVVSLEGEFFGLSTVKRVMDSMNYYFQRDLTACREAQDVMMTPRNPGVENVIHHASFVEPLSGPGGDYVDVFELNENLAVLVLFDVCGKGIKAANMVMALGSMLHMMFQELDAPSIDFRALNMTARLERLNRLLWEITPGEMYATGVVLVLDKASCLLQVYDFGHGFLWLRRGGKVHILKSTVNQHIDLPFIGMQPDLQMLPANVRMKPGDVVFTCSDGIPEARNMQKEEFGVQRITEAMKKTRDPAALVELVREEVARFMAGYRRGDDFSALSFSL